jgi:hypothetical protein
MLPLVGWPACLPACSLSALENCQALLLFNTLQEVTPNTGCRHFRRKEMVDGLVKPGRENNMYLELAKEMCVLKICVVLWL